MRRTATCLAAAVLVVTGCAESADNDTISADAELIVALWDGFSAVWDDGLENAYRYIADHNYPALECSAAELREHFAFPTGHSADFVVDEKTIKLDSDWSLELIGGTPEGRVYVMSGMLREGSESAFRRATLHSTVLDGEPYFFFQCS